MNDTDKVINTLKRQGWHRGELRGPDGSVCLMGAALDASLVFNGERKSAMDYINNALQPVVERLFPGRSCPDVMVNPMHPVAQFNDHPDTTLEDVHLVLKHAREE